MQAECIIAKFFLIGNIPFRLMIAGLSPISSMIMSPTIILLLFLCRPTFRIFFARDQLQYETHPTFSFVNFSDFPSMENGNFICIAGLIVIINLLHSVALCSINKNRCFSLQEIISKFFRQNQLKHHATTEIKHRFCIMHLQNLSSSIKIH